MNKLFKSPRQRAKAFLLLTSVLSVFIIFYFISPALIKVRNYLATESSNSIPGRIRIQKGPSSFERIKLLDPLQLLDLFGRDLMITEVSEPTETQFEEGVKQIEQNISVEGDFRSLIYFQYELDTLRSNCKVKAFKIFKGTKTDRLKGEFQFSSLYPKPVL
jgi:hypothetical protein